MNQNHSHSETRTVALRLDPLDVLFFRDGRPFTEATRGQSGLPRPQTLAGAVRTHLMRGAGCDMGGFSKLAERLRAGQNLEQAITDACGAGWIARVEIRGPWLAREDKGQLDVLVPLPANIHELKDGTRPVAQSSLNHNGPAGPEGKRNQEWVRWEPLMPRLELPGWTPPIPGLRPLWLRRRVRTERRLAYLKPNGLKAFLKGEGFPPEEVAKPEELYGFEQRTGIAIQPDHLTAAEHLIYAVSLLALRRGVCFYAEVDLPDEAPADVFDGDNIMDLGGEGRKVCVKPVARFAWPSAPPQDGRLLLLLTTPAAFAERWRPRLPQGVELIAATVNGYEAFSGWDLARGGPKPTRFAVPAGSVYFLESHNGQLFNGSLAESDEDRRLGYGCVLQGVWNYA